MKEEVIDIKFPESWNELSDEQLKAIATVLFTKQTAVQGDAAILGVLMGVGKLNFENNKRFNTLIENVALSDIKSYYDFIYKETNRTNFIQSIDIGGVVYYAPKPKLFNLSIEEFSIAEDYFSRFRESGDEGFLPYLAGVLYTPGGKDLRPAFHLEEMEAKAEPFKTAPRDFLLACFLAYQGCHFFIEERYKWVYRQKARQTKADAKKSKTKEYGLGKIILAMAGGKFGNHAQTRRTRVHTFMEVLNEDLSPKNRKKK